MRFNIRAIGIAAATTASVTYILCGVFVAVAPGVTSAFFSWMFHIDLSGMARQITVTSFLGGLVLFSAFVGICVAVTAWLYNKMMK